MLQVAASDHGLAPRLHADEFVDSKRRRTGRGDRSTFRGPPDRDFGCRESRLDRRSAGVTAVLLPGTSFFLMKHTYAPARRLIEGWRSPVALATDCNPGSSFTESMPMVFVLGVYELGLSIEEALTAATLNAACSLGLGAQIGSIEPDKHADLVLLDAPNLLHLGYHYGVNPVRAVVRTARSSTEDSRIHPSPSIPLAPKLG